MNAIILSALLGVVMMFSGIVLKNKQSIVYTAIISLVVLLLGNVFETYGKFAIHVNTHEMLAFSKFGYFFSTIAIAATLLYVMLSGRDVVKVGNYPAEYFALIFFILCGVSILSSFNNLLMLFIGIEIVTIPLYILTGSDKKNLKSNEASLKYFLMGAFSTGLMLMGIALIYGASGSFGIETVKMSSPIPGGALPQAPILDVIGLMFVFASLLFKVSAAPFHFWTPDVYDGAPSVFTSFMSTIVKAAAFVAFIHLFENKAEEMGSIWKMLMVLTIIATLLVGNITAVFQQSVKRMLAYSSIAQAGFMLFALYSRNDMAKEGILLYSVAYTVATVGIFAILIKMKDYTFDGYNGLAKTQPLLAAVNTVFILSLSGIPLTAGFFAKYWMLASVIKAGGSFAVWLVVIAVLFAAVSVYYYFRVIQSMYFKEGEPETTEISSGFKIGLLVMAAIIIILGVYPDGLLQFLYF
jgi:NADH-quinone oxidoreductase subunit N